MNNNTDNLQIVAKFLNMALKSRGFIVKYDVEEENIIARAEGFEFKVFEESELDKVYKRTLTLKEFDLIVKDHIEKLS